MPRPGLPREWGAQARHLVHAELPPFARLEILDCESGVLAAVQPANGMTDCFAHSLDLVLSALMEDELEPRGTESAHLGRRGEAVFQLHALCEPPESLRGRTAFHLGFVHLVHLVTRMSEPVRQRS